MAALTTGVPACHAPLMGRPDRAPPVLTRLDPLGTSFLRCAAAPGQIIETLVCQRSQPSRGIASACNSIEPVGPPDNLLLQLRCGAPHGGIEYRGEDARRTTGNSTSPSGRGRCGGTHDAPMLRCRTR